MTTVCVATRHGTVNAYRHYHCRCPVALTRWRRYRKLYQAGLLDPAYVDATGIHRRIRSMQADGYPLLTIAEALGYKRGNHGSLSPTLARQRIRRDRAERIIELYERWERLPGPSPYTALRAQRAGHPPSWMWRGLDIDDPATHPATSSNTPPASGSPWLEAVCRSPRSDPSDWFGGTRDVVLTAVSGCMRCPMQRECLRGALVRRERHGIWGGLTEEQRDSLVDQLARRLDGRPLDGSPELDDALDRFAGRRQDALPLVGHGAA